MGESLDGVGQGKPERALGQVLGLLSSQPLLQVWADLPFANKEPHVQKG